MTYCVGMVLDKGLVLMSDTRTNSGVDNISVFQKMFRWQVAGERMIAVMTAGNLATAQAVIGQLEERMKAPNDRDNILLKSPTMFQVATEIGRLLRTGVLSEDVPVGDVPAAQDVLAVALAPREMARGMADKVASAMGASPRDEVRLVDWSSSSRLAIEERLRKCFQ